MKIDFNIKDLRKQIPNFKWAVTRPDFGVVKYEGTYPVDQQPQIIVVICNRFHILDNVFVYGRSNEDQKPNPCYKDLHLQHSGRFVSLDSVAGLCQKAILNNLLRTLSPEELEAVPVPSPDEIRQAIRKMNKIRHKRPHPSKGPRYDDNT